MTYFSVKKIYKINGKTYKPCVTYELSAKIEENVKRLVQAGNAEIFNEYRFFQNGKRIEKPVEKKAETVSIAVKQEKKKQKKEVKEEVKEEKPAAEEVTEELPVSEEE